MLFVEVGGEFIIAEWRIVIPSPDLLNEAEFHQVGEVHPAGLLRPSRPGGEVLGVSLVYARPGLREGVDDRKGEKVRALQVEFVHHPSVDVETVGIIKFRHL